MVGRLWKGCMAGTTGMASESRGYSRRGNGGKRMPGKPASRSGDWKVLAAGEPAGYGKDLHSIPIAILTPPRRSPTLQGERALRSYKIVSYGMIE